MIIFLWFLKKKNPASSASQYYKESPVAIEDALTHMVNIIEMHFNFFLLLCREEIQNHSVSWKTSYNFQCKVTANASTGFLDPCICRVSVRMVGTAAQNVAH